MFLKNFSLMCGIFLLFMPAVSCQRPQCLVAQEAALAFAEQYYLLCFVHTHIAYPCPGNLLKCKGSAEQTNKLNLLVLGTVIKLLY